MAKYQMFNQNFLKYKTKARCNNRLPEKTPSFISAYLLTSLMGTFFDLFTLSNLTCFLQIYEEKNCISRAQPLGFDHVETHKLKLRITCHQKPLMQTTRTWHKLEPIFITKQVHAMACFIQSS